MRALLPTVVLLVLCVPALAAPEATHTGVVQTEHLEIRYRPGSRAAAGVDRVAAMAERDLAAMEAILDIEVQPPRWKLFLYDDVRELQAVTGAVGAGGFSVPDASHVPYDNDQTRFHELAHVVTYRLPKSGDETRNRFFPDGMANAMLEFVHGVHVHAVAAFTKREGKLPSIEAMTTGDFYEWIQAHPGVSAYDVAASWLRFLLDTYGAKRLRRYYTGTPIRKAMGASRETVEAKWRAMLDAYEIRPEVERLLRIRRGETLAFEPFEAALLEALLGGDPAWTDLTDADLRPKDEGVWSRADGAIRAVNGKGAWAICELGTGTYGDCVVRARIRTPRSTALQVRLGPENQAMLVNGVFLYRGDRPVASSEVARMDGTRRSTDFVLVRRGAMVQIWIDGVLALTTGAAGGASPVGIGVHGGEAVFEDVRVRRLP
jgi:hypothetical protein